MIDVKSVEIEKLRTVKDEELRRISDADGQLGIPIVLKFPENGFGIFVPAGLYQRDNQRVFGTLTEVHEILSEFDFKRFVQDGWLKEFS